MAHGFASLDLIVCEFADQDGPSTSHEAAAVSTLRQIHVNIFPGSYIFFIVGETLREKWQYIVRGLLAAKKILTSKAASTPKEYLAVYVGERQKKKYMVPVSFLNQPSFQALLCKAEEEFGFDNPMGGLTIPCPEDTFVAIASQLR